MKNEHVSIFYMIIIASISYFLSCVPVLPFPYDNLLSLRCRLTPLHFSGDPQAGEELQEEELTEETEE